MHSISSTCVIYNVILQLFLRSCMCISKLGFNPSDTIFDGPFSVRVTVGASAIFTCTVPCTDAITWFATKLKIPHAPRQSISALTNHTKIASQYTNEEVYTEALIITATVDINTTLLQCAAMNFDVCRNAAECKLRPRICFSRFAEITGKVDQFAFHQFAFHLWWYQYWHWYHHKTSWYHHCQLLC